ncbi:MAG: rRNA maturation RNase YbeY [Proteobacteria bacterium]|nr:rRNA maturation RNase YbeY [Pseudomonadota bacterium]
MSVHLLEPPSDGGGPTLDLPRLRRRARGLLRHVGRGRSELSVALVDDEAMRELNQRYRGKARPTDVLSFSLQEGPHAEHAGDLLGDVVIDVQEAARQARRAHRGVDDVVARLLIHGVLHLLGHDHERDDEARVMQMEERRLWRLLRG